MALLRARELLEFPTNPNNATDTLINGVHFNQTALNHFNYTLYSNGTLSNGSNCVLTFDIYKPHMLSNGTFINGTSCYSPIEPIATGGSVGIAFATLFALTILFSVINLRKHGRRFLPIHKKWSIVGRRWQWYWLLFLGACGTISGFMSIDVDRNYLHSLPIILQSIFYHMMLPIMLAAVWEGVRHWGSWLERQIYDRDAFAFEADTTRERQELYLPMVFYLFGFLNFFLTVPRSWTSIQKQRSPEQQANMAMPSATDGRLKGASIIVIPCIVLTCYSIGHSLYRYKECPRDRSPVIFYATSIPVKFILVVLLATVRVGFNIAAAFDFDVSPLKSTASPGWLYGLGHAPALLVLIIFNIWGYIDPNEDRALIKQRIARGHATDVELGIEAGRRKPDWWRLMRTDVQHVSGADPNSRLQAMVNNMAGKPKTQDPNQDVEMGDLNRNQKEEELKPTTTKTTEPPTDYKRPAGPQRQSNLLSPELSPTEDRQPAGPRRESNLLSPELPPPRTESNAGSQFTSSSGDTLTSQAPPQKVRSMLDI